MRSGISPLGGLLTGNSIECESGDPNDQRVNVDRGHQMSQKCDSDAIVYKDDDKEEAIETSSD